MESAQDKNLTMVMQDKETLQSEIEKGYVSKFAERYVLENKIKVDSLVEHLRGIVKSEFTTGEIVIFTGNEMNDNIEAIVLRDLNEAEECMIVFEQMEGMIKDFKINNESILNLINKTYFNNHYQIDNQGVYLRYDTCDSDSRQQSANWDFVRDELEEYGLQLDDPLIEHDCISGYVVKL